jgi:hypothetical protein
MPWLSSFSLNGSKREDDAQDPDPHGAPFHVYSVQAVKVAASIAPQLGRGNALDWMYAQLTSSPSQKGMTLLLAVSAAGYGLDCLITGARIAFCCRYSGSGTIGFNG